MFNFFLEWLLLRVTFAKMGVRLWDCEGEIVKIIDLPANDSWTKPCKLRVHNEDGRNTMKPIFGGNSNFRWKFMARCQKRLNAGNCAADLMLENGTRRSPSKRKLSMINQKDRRIRIVYLVLLITIFHYFETSLIYYLSSSSPIHWISFYCNSGSSGNQQFLTVATELHKSHHLNHKWNTNFVLLRGLCFLLQCCNFPSHLQKIHSKFWLPKTS